LSAVGSEVNRPEEGKRYRPSVVCVHTRGLEEKRRAEKGTKLLG